MKTVVKYEPESLDFPKLLREERKIYYSGGEICVELSKYMGVELQIYRSRRRYK